MALHIQGVIPPVVTPLISCDQLDVEAVDRVTEHLIDGGVAGLFVLGTTGEGPSQTYQTRYEMVERTCQAADKRVPVLTCVTDTSIGESLALAAHAADCGSAAIVAAAPYYFEASQRALFRWFFELAEQSPLPLMLYNMPSCVGVDLEFTTVCDLSQHPNIIGIKDSSGNLELFSKLCQQFRGRDDFRVYMGPEELLAEAVHAGAAGGVCGGANLLPHVYVELYEAAVAHDSDAIQRWQRVIHSVFQSVYRDATGRMNLIPALKAAMQECGLCRDVVAPPFSPLCEEHRRQIVTELPRILQTSDSPLSAGSL
ncbi:MAG: dihydrodipicolinate synthase family protein [Planctomyces sp.]|nr:dihydrodipicolinate synthase family protein [Planctomyces sp.]